MWINSFSDEKGGVTRHPWNAGWPLELHSTLTLEEQAGNTTATIRWAPLNPTDEERQTFEAGFDSMTPGWGGTLDQLGEYLAKAK